jgi:phosphoribosylformimino-5-aminoimidazole carboxamide ribonucleotide (ProFAR) isomerase
MIEAGCAGVDLLAFRATDADPLDLIRAARSATDRPVIVAGSIDSPARIEAIREAGADLFTIGTAALDGSFNPRYGLLANQLDQILEACRR